MKAFIKEYELKGYYEKGLSNKHINRHLKHKMLKQDIEFCYDEYFLGKPLDECYYDTMLEFERAELEDFIVYENWLECEF